VRALISLGFVLIWATVPSAFAGDYSLPSNGIIVESINKNDTAIEIPVSAVFFKESDKKNPASGFYAEKTVLITGRYAYHVLDFPVGKPSSDIFQQFLNKSKDLGYDIVFQCKQDECGKKDGYRTYLSKRLNDGNNTQAYLVAQKGNIYRSIYVADLDGQARGFFLEAVDKNQPDNSESASNLVLFPTGKSDLSVSAKEKIDRWVAATIKDKSQIVSVFGNADSSGGLIANIKLAQDRANAVRSYMIERHHLSASRLVSLSAANLARPLGASRGRFVELVAHSSL